MAKTYTTAAEDAKRIRETLKREHGWTGRQVSVRSENFSMGSAIRVEIKDPSVAASVVERVANEAERIDRCEITGEILSGCNRYVSVGHSREARLALAAERLEAVEAALAELDELDRGVHADVAGTEYSVSRDLDGWTVALYGESGRVAGFNRTGAAEAIAFEIGKRERSREADGPETAEAPEAPTAEEAEECALGCVDPATCPVLVEAAEEIEREGWGHFSEDAHDEDSCPECRPEPSPTSSTPLRGEAGEVLALARLAHDAARDAASRVDHVGDWVAEEGTFPRLIASDALADLRRALALFESVVNLAAKADAKRRASVAESRS